MLDQDDMAISDAETDVTESDWNPDFRRNQERKSLMKRILSQCGRDDGQKKPLNIAIIGTAGVGKSAFINTIAAAVGGDSWDEYAYSGSFGDVGGGITVFTSSFQKCCREDLYQTQNLPTLIDVAGFEDQKGEQFTELLRILFYGRLPVGESLGEAAAYYTKRGIDGLREKYSQNNEALKVDRVIFLTSADIPVPENLIECVVQAARPAGTAKNPRRRTLPLYGVMLKFDKVVTRKEYERKKGAAGVDGNKLDVIEETEYEKRETRFIHCLGLGGSKHRFLRCSNYCDNVDPGNTRIDSVMPEIDLPVLRLLTQVTNPSMKVQNEAETYTDRSEPVADTPEVREANTTHGNRTRERRTRDQNQRGGSFMNALTDNFGGNRVSLFIIAVEVVLVAVILSYLLKPQIDLTELKAICNHMKDPNLVSTLSKTCKSIQDPASSVSFYLALVALVALRMIVSVLLSAIKTG